MYGYVLDGTIETRDKSALEGNKEVEHCGPDRSPLGDGWRRKYTVLSVSLSDCEITWCSGPGISTIFVAKNESPHDFIALSREPSAFP